MKNTKRFVSILALIALLLCLAGCGKKTVYTLRMEGIGDYEVIGAPDGVVNYSANGSDIRITVDKDGTYPFTLKDAEGAEHPFTFTVKDGACTTESEEGTTVTVTKE